MFRKRLFSGAALGLVLAAVTAVPAQAATKSTTVDTSVCDTNPLLSQPFLSAGDSNYYTLAPGQSADSFTGAGWTLTGGAQIVSTTLADATTGSVLQLPFGGAAISPIMCVQANYPTARLLVRDVVGGPSTTFLVSYETATGWSIPKISGAPGVGSDWALSPDLTLDPAQVAGWQPVRFVLAGTARNSVSQVYDLYIDPRMAH
jgi:hypothetical protein